MKKNRRRIINILFSIFILAYSISAYSQYSAETVLEKSFEQMDIFFVPNYLNPYGIGAFGNVTTGLLDDPLLNLNLNPANLYADSSRHTYFYMDFRNSKVVEKNNQYYPLYGGIDYYRYSSLYYPSYYIESRKELEPIFTAALLSRPFKKTANGLFLGLTYKAIAQDEDYYAIPQDIYRAGVGYDYSGNRTAEDTNIPIVDKYSGENKMHQVGHFFNFYSGYDFSNTLKLGIKLSRVLFERDGAYGSKNFWESNYRLDNTSLYYSMEQRDQDYDHWDFTGGVKYQLTGRFALGLQGGYLWGNATQNMIQQDSSFYSYGQVDVGKDWSLYQKAGRGIKSWEHDGKTYYGGFDVNYKISPTKTFNFYYQYQKQDQDIVLNATVRDTSYSNYYSTWENEYSRSNSDYSLYDIRSGTGAGKTTTHQFMAALQWQIEDTKKLNIGLHVEIQNRKINTVESVVASRQSRYYYDSSWQDKPSDYFDATNEAKNLYWDFKAKRTNVQVPIIFNWKVSKVVELLFGLNRNMATWKIDDVTLAIFNYREQTVDSTTTKKTNFGERYTQPEEKRTDVETYALFGMTISPSKSFSVRMLVVPNFKDSFDGSELSDLQWWIGLNLYP